jgi:hypothetical protein
MVRGLMIRRQIKGTKEREKELFLSSLMGHDLACVCVHVHACVMGEWLSWLRLFKVGHDHFLPYPLHILFLIYLMILSVA